MILKAGLRRSLSKRKKKNVVRLIREGKTIKLICDTKNTADMVENALTLDLKTVDKIFKIPNRQNEYVI